MPSVDLAPGLSIHYLESNPGGHSTVLLLHGLGSTGASWQLQTPSLVAAGYRVIAPDARGFGQSTYPGGWRVAEWAGDFAQLLQVLRIGQIDLVGISMGGLHALQLVLDHPELVRRLVLVNTFARLRPGGPRTWGYYASRFIIVHTLGLATQARVVVKSIFPKPEQEFLRRELMAEIVQASPQGYRAAMRSLALFNVEKRLGKIRVPTLVITGQCDTTIPPETQASLVKGIPGVKQVVIPQAGHAVSVDQPELFNRTLLDFLLAP